MKILIQPFCCFILLIAGFQVHPQALPIVSCLESQDAINTNYSKAKDVKEVLQRLVKEGVPGVSMALYTDDEGWWEASAGYAKIEDKTLMQSCHLQYLQSVSKTYMAIAILKLSEQGKIELEQPITTYLPARYCHFISNPEKITVRMLLSHTSGIPEYNLVPAYVGYLLQHPDHFFSPEDYLKYIEGKPLDFVPGSKYSYRNTNYLLLALMTDAITGDHTKFIKETIMRPLVLTNTFYRGDPGYLTYSNLVNAY